MFLYVRAVHGRLLDFLCAQDDLEEGQCARFIRQLLDALQYLHLCRIVHLDVKVRNGVITLCMYDALFIL